MALEDAKSDIDTAFTRKGLRGPSFENAFAGATSFLRRTYTKDLSGVDLAITGVAFDQATTHRPGTRFGPRALREASTLLAADAPFGWGTDPLSDMAVIDYGDLAFDYAHTAGFPAALTDHIATILAAGAGAITLGGDHYITFPILRAYAEKYGPLGLIHFDAHSDLWPDDNPDRIDHGTMLYKAVKAGYVDPKRSLQIGIRTTTEDYLGVHVLTARELHEKGTAHAVALAKDIVGDRPTYVTFDIDALDPAYAPGTGTPVWGGLHSWQAAAILRDLAGINMVGGDVVEVSPPYDTTGATAVAGAHVAYDLICLYHWARTQR
ncbi:agmatinase [Rhodobacteraceae bacterium HSP-20]|uniref:Agmatinase n=1 Tax=Paragemmobacter amnigenus TaxID=2852097 RepID=A0ABS6IXL2_9RHOB|nr:agmatinase [Rhodobacter amnigenus]MBU9696251.1 agmatinase [Rhodobacter amnigenus]MBV4387478.1 agmatinase [Rhodobacter amnigenus]